MAKITQMLIHNIELEKGAWGEYWVGHEYLCGYPEYNENIDENMFFHLACQWLDESGDFYSTEDAKIDLYSEAE